MVWFNFCSLESARLLLYRMITPMKRYLHHCGFSNVWKFNAIRILVCILLFVNGALIYAQNYIPLSYATPYPQNLVEFQGNGSFVQDTNGIIFGGFSHGVFEFDGKRKIFQAIENSVLSIDLHRPQNKIWIATQGSFGYLSPTLDGQLSYIDVSAKKLTVNERPNDLVAHVFAFKDVIHIYYPSVLYVINPNDNSFTVHSLKTKDGGTSLGAFALKERLYVSFPDKGVCRFEGNKFLPIIADPVLATHYITHFHEFDKDQVLFSLSQSNQLFLFDGKQITPYATQAGSIFAATNDEITGLAVINGLVLASTSLNGCIVLDKTTGNTASILNIRYGIPANEINAIYGDKDGRVWMAHTDKISWNYINFPINKYDQGYSGNVNDIINTDNIYIATDNGLYYFTQTRNSDVINEGLFKNIVDQFKKIKPTVVEKVVVPDAPKLEVIQQQIAQTSTVEAPKTDPEKAGGGIGGIFKGKKKKEEEKRLAEEKLRQEQLAYQQEQERIRREAEAKAANAEAERQAAIQKNLEAEAQRQREIEERQRIAQMYEELKASRQIQTKIIDFDIVPGCPAEKFTDLLSYNGMLLAGSVNGLYTVANNRVDMLMKKSVKLLFASEKYKERIYVLSPENNFGCFIVQNNQWDYINIVKVSEYVSSMTEDRSGNLWLGTLKGAIRLDVDNLSISPKLQRLSPIEDKNTVSTGKAVVVRSLEGRVVLFQNQKAFTYENNSFRELPVLSNLCQKSSTYRLVKGGSQYWFLTGTRLYKLSVDPSLNQISVTDSSRILALTERINAFFADENDQIWLGDNQRVLRFVPAKATAKEPNKNFKCIIRTVQTVQVEDGKTIKTTVANLNEELILPYAGHYNIEFEFSAPAFDQSSNVRYQYKLGNDDNWKEIEVNKLNLEFEWGKYEVRVRALDAFGNMSEEAVFRFEINAPFWAKWYFWVIVVGIIGFAVFKYVQYRQRALIKRKEELEREVERATLQIREQNDQLEQSNGLLQKQSLELQEQNVKLERFNVEISKQKEEIAVQKELSDSLLLNILPVQIAEELKAKNKADARKYELVSVLFTDFKGFTMAAEKMTPEQLVIELNECFMKFDEIIDRHHLEKIKTLGDGYMCAGGVPTPNVTNPVEIVLAGLEIQRYMNNFAVERTKLNKLAWQVRLGIHSGELIAGVVGKKKFAYDIWGDTVNTASRMESSGEAGKVNISGVTYELVKDFFECTYRGKIPAKNKGEISMYFVEGVKRELTINGDGVTPNEKFRNMLEDYTKKMSLQYNLLKEKIV